METKEFRLGRMKCYLLMLAYQAPTVGWVLGAVVVATLVAGFLVSPWVGLVTVGVDAFLCVMVMSLIIMAYGLGSVTGCNMSLHTLSVTAQTLSVNFEEGSPLVFEKKRLGRYTIYPGGIVVPIDGKKGGWIWVASRAFEQGADMAEFIKRLYDRGDGV